MIDILDKKGNPLGLEYDYEYRGANRETNRDAPMKRANATWLFFAALFAFAGVLMIVKSLNGTGGASVGGVLFVSLFSFGFAALFVCLMITGIRKHKELLERIGHGN